MLVGSLGPRTVLDTPGWHADLDSDSSAFVVFPSQFLWYEGGDRAPYQGVKTHVRAAGLPEHQVNR